VLHQSEPFVFKGSGEPDVAHDLRHRQHFEQQLRRFEILAEDDRAILALQCVAETGEQIAVVVDDQDDALHGRLDGTKP